MKMDLSNELEQRAIDAAMISDWQKAIECNSKLVHSSPKDISAYLRLGYAYFQLNDLKGAKSAYRKVLKLQPKNNIATTHLEKIKILESKKKKKTKPSTIFDPGLFLDIQGKTKTVHLTNLGKKEDLASLSPGEEIELKEKKHRIEARSLNGDYIGTLPDDISKRLIYFIKEGSEYKSYIKEIDLTDAIIYIKEIAKGKKVRQFPSFPADPHVMLSDIMKLDAMEEETDEDSEDDEEGDDEITDDLDIDDEDEETDDEWEELQEQEELGSLVQLEEEEEE